MAYDHYLKQPKLLCEILLNKILAKNLRLIDCLNRFSSSPFFREYTNHKMLFDNERK